MSDLELAAVDEQAPVQIKSSHSSLRRLASSEFLQFKYQHSVGHQGAVLCNDASDDMEWVLSGGEDGTARLWHYNEKHYECYRLFLVIHHESKVTSVAFAGKRGPAVTATASGDIWITSIKHGNKTKFDSSNDPISDVRVKREEYEGKDDWLLAVAAGTRASLTEASSVEDGTYECNQIASFDHGEEKVRSAQHVPGKVGTGAALVTAASMYIRVWALPTDDIKETSVPLLRLEDADHRMFRCFHLQESNKGWGWLAAGAGNFLSFWPLRNGKVYNEESRSIDSADWPVRYRFSDEVKDVTIDPNCEFFMVQRADMTSELRQIAVPEDKSSPRLNHERSYLDLFVSVDKPLMTSEDDDDMFVQAPGDHGGKLPRHKNSATLCTIEHTVESSEVCMRKSAGNMAALLSMLDGTVSVWDLQGDHMGEQTADNRSMTYIAIMTPILMRLVSFVQVAMFAFGPATNYSDSVEKPIRITRNVVFLNATSALSEFPEVTPAMLFFPQIALVMALMLVYLILVFTAAPEMLTAARTKLMRTKSYIDKTWCSWLAVVFIKLIRSGIGFLIGSCSTVLVVPMFKICAKVVDCTHPEDGSKPYLSAQPAIHCFEGVHWKLIGAFALVLPIYFLMLLPYAVVNGDSKFMSRKYLSSPAIWEKQAIRKATLMYQGPLHPECRSIFGIRLTELLTKIALPVIVIETTGLPLVQTVLIALCGLSSYVVNLVWRPLVDSTMCAVYQSMELFQLLCMCVGVATVALPGGKQWSTLAVLAAFVVSVASVLLQISRVPPEELETDELRSLNSNREGFELLKNVE